MPRRACGRVRKGYVEREMAVRMFRGVVRERITAVAYATRGWVVGRVFDWDGRLQKVETRDLVVSRYLGFGFEGEDEISRHERRSRLG